MTKIPIAVLFAVYAITGLTLSAFQQQATGPTAGQIQEAVEFGRTNHGSIEKVLATLYSCCDTTKDILIRTKWSKLALLSGIKAQQGKDISAQDKKAILEDPSLQIDITVKGHTIEFARGHSAYIMQSGKKILPDQLHADHFQSGRKPQKAVSLSGYYAIIRTYFKYDALDMGKPFTLVLAKPQGTQEYKIDPGKYK